MSNFTQMKKTFFILAASLLIIASGYFFYHSSTATTTRFKAVMEYKGMNLVAPVKDLKIKLLKT
jgi:hypothetical protein